MEQRYFGSTQRQVAVIGQGTWYDENEDPASAVAALRLGLDRGMKHIDTAEMYGSGAAEELDGEAIAGRRDEVFLVSKVLPNRTPGGTRPSRRVRNLCCALIPTAWIVTFCTGVGAIRWRKRSRLSSSCAAKEKYSPGA